MFGGTDAPHPERVGEHDASLLRVIEQGMAQLAGEMVQGRSDRLLQYLAFTARFHQYSHANQFLIYVQRPTATRVAGYRTWQRLGYQVARGEKGIRILAPRTSERVDADTGEVERVTYFVSVSVFDASQLANLHKNPLPAFFVPLADDQQELTDRLIQVVEADGIAISESAHLGETQGYSAHGRIVLKAGLDSRRRFLVLTHEYAHELLHWEEQGRQEPRPVKECQAEAVSYVVATYFGLHNPFSADYLLQWATLPADLSQELAAVTKAAGHIITRLERVQEPGAGAQRPTDQGTP